MKLKENKIRTISKTLSIQVAPVKKKRNTRNAIANQLKFVILLAAGLGVNRTYLLKYRRVVKWFFHLYCTFINLTTVYALFNTDEESATSKVLRDTGCLEYVLLVLIAMLSHKSSLFNIFEDLCEFDELLNIKEDLDVTFPVTREILWTVLSVLYTLIEFIYLILYIYDESAKEMITTLISYITLMTHDLEHVLICSLLRAILMRVRILRAHVEKALGNRERIHTNMDKVEVLSKKAQLDLNSLHKTYELLHKCAEQLNSVMSLPMMVMLLSSGLSSIMLLKGLFRVLQTTAIQQEAEKVIVLYSVTRCLKYTFLVIVPCYYSSTTTSQVSHIRILLHDAMNTDKIGKLERRRIKAFFQLTRESEFAYALWGVIKLNMSLPLSYLSLCTTYLVIIIQFSKFID